MTTTYQATQAFLAVCHNEIFASYRDMEPALATAARALMDGWLPPLSELHGRFLQRGGYLVELLAAWMPAPQAPEHAKLASTFKHSQASFEAVPFFHQDPAHGPCWDEVALNWGLTRGVNVSRLRQSLRSPYVV